MNTSQTPRLIATMGALAALVAFFLPWVEYRSAAFTGAQLAGAVTAKGGLRGFDTALYLVPVLALVAAGLLIAGRTTADAERDARTRFWAAAAAVAGLCIAILFLGSALLGGAPGVQFQPGLVRTDQAVRTTVGTALGAGEFVALGVGTWLAIVGFAAAALGALVQRARAEAIRAQWRTQDYVLVAVLAVVFGAIYWAWLQPWIWAQSIGAQFAQELFFGMWFVSGLVGGYIIRRPGAAFLAETLAAFAEVLLGAPAGPVLLITGLMQALGAELVFASTGYRRWGWTTLALAGAAAAIVALPWNWFRLGYFALDAGLLAGLFVVRLLSGVAAGVVAKGLADALAATGSLNYFAVGRERVREV